MPTNFIITDGPSTHEIALSFVYAFNKRHPFEVEFRGHWQDDAQTTLPVDAKVIALSYESGADGMLLLEIQGKIGHGDSWTAAGFYNAHSRMGHLESDYTVSWRKKSA